jgi:hypothetical protein
MSLSNHPLFTWHDAVDYLLDEVVGGDGSNRSRRQARRAIESAYAELPARRDWRCYYRRVYIQTVSSQTTGTISFDVTGGAYERMVTLSSATWPDDVDQYRISIDNKTYEIESRKSSTIITLSERSYPAADITAGESYTLFKDTYALPDDFRRMAYLHDVEAPGTLLSQVDPAAVECEQRLVRTASLPSMYTITGNSAGVVGQAVTFAPAPSTARTYMAMMQFWPKPLKIYDFNSGDGGTVAVTSGSAAVTGTSTAFTSDHEGSVLRVSKNGSTKIPTSQIGEIDKDRHEPFTLQRVIKTYTSATALTLQHTSDQTLSGSGFRVSSRIDIEPGAMRNAFMRLAEAHFGMHDRKGLAERMQAYERAYNLAAWADQRMIEGPWVRNTWGSLTDMAASVDASGDD